MLWRSSDRIDEIYVSVLFQVHLLLLYFFKYICFMS